MQKVTCCRACNEVVLLTDAHLRLDARPYGADLAERVADFLEAGGEIPSRHPYFDGVCLAKASGEFLYGYANVAGAPAFDDSTEIIHRFSSRPAFVAWLAAQSDLTLNRGPATGLRLPGVVGITRSMLESAIGPDDAERK